MLQLQRLTMTVLGRPVLNFLNGEMIAGRWAIAASSMNNDQTFYMSAR